MFLAVELFEVDALYIRFIYFSLSGNSKFLPKMALLTQAE